MNNIINEQDSLSYRDGFKNLLLFIKFECVVAIILAGINVYVVKNIVPQDSYYAANANGTTQPMTGLLSPNMNTAAILSWASQAATDVLTFGFNDINQRFTYAKSYFSPDGWDSFKDGLDKAKLLKAVTANEQIITAIGRSPPTLAYQGFYLGKYSYVVTMPIVMTIRAGGVKANKYVTVRMVIVRMPTAENPMGIGIENWQSG